MISAKMSCGPTTNTCRIRSNAGIILNPGYLGIVARFAWVHRDGRNPRASRATDARCDWVPHRRHAPGGRAGSGASFAYCLLRSRVLTHLLQWTASWRPWDISVAPGPAPPSPRVGRRVRKLGTSMDIFGETNPKRMPSHLFHGAVSIDYEADRCRGRRGGFIGAAAGRKPCDKAGWKPALRLGPRPWRRLQRANWKFANGYKIG